MHACMLPVFLRVPLHACQVLSADAVWSSIPTTLTLPIAMPAPRSLGSAADPFEMSVSLGLNQPLATIHEIDSMARASASELLDHHSSMNLGTSPGRDAGGSSSIMVLGFGRASASQLARMSFSQQGGSGAGSDGKLSAPESPVSRPT